MSLWTGRVQFDNLAETFSLNVRKQMRSFSFFPSKRSSGLVEYVVITEPNIFHSKCDNFFAQNSEKLYKFRLKDLNQNGSLDK